MTDPSAVGVGQYGDGGVCERMRGDPALVLEVLDRINHLPADLSVDDTIQQAVHEVAACWTARTRCPSGRARSTGGSWGSPS